MFGPNDSVLIAVAHPDDEVLCAAGLGAAAVAAGASVRACLLVGQASARRHRPEAAELADHARQASQILAFEEPLFGDFPNIRLNAVPHLDLVQFIEEAMVTVQANVLVTHHASDLNNDHHHVVRAVVAASRLGRRRPGIAPLRGVLFGETLSSTDWAVPGIDAPFTPHLFIPMTAEAVDRKVDALRVYAGVLRDPPHSRSESAVRALAALRGAQAHVEAAEAFQVGYWCPTA
jgi:LmbE family N-acetylglucosaminyl deacetylase